MARLRKQTCSPYPLPPKVWSINEGKDYMYTHSIWEMIDYITDTEDRPMTVAEIRQRLADDYHVHLDVQQMKYQLGKASVLGSTCWVRHNQYANIKKPEQYAHRMRVREWEAALADMLS